jgi:hypothetical protein
MTDKTPWTVTQDASWKLLSQMLDTQIEREGRVSSFMVRAGLLRDLLDRHESQAELVDNLRLTIQALDAFQGRDVPFPDFHSWEANSRALLAKIGGAA